MKRLEETHGRVCLLAGPAGNEEGDNLRRWRSLKPNNSGCSSDCGTQASSQ
jgi:hypothetical protein